jgi:homoserine trans-succinylase
MMLCLVGALASGQPCASCAFILSSAKLFYLERIGSDCETNLTLIMHNSASLEIAISLLNLYTYDIRVQYTTEKQTKQFHVINWHEVFEEIKIHESNYGIVIHGTSTDDLDLDDPETIELLETANGLDMNASLQK